jgi:histidyl-tRNA synthetase
LKTIIMSDPLFDVKTFFYLGNTQLAINEASKVRPRDEATKIEKDFYVYRSFIEQGNFSVVLDEIKSDSPAALQATRALAAYLSKAESKDATVSKLKSLEETGDELVALVAAIFYLHDNQLESALRAIFSSKRLDAYAIVVFTCAHWH